MIKRNPIITANLILSKVNHLTGSDFHYQLWALCSSVCSFVRPTVPRHIKVFGRTFFYEVRGPINLKLSTNQMFPML